MSLLLDALKKAADEKNTSTTEGQLLSDTGSDTELDTPAHSDSDNNSSMELELNDEFPEVDDTSIRSKQTHHIETTKTSEESIHSNSTEEKPDVPEAPLALEETPAPTQSSNDINHTSPSPESSSDELAKQARQNKLAENIRNEQALSALINKSNQFTLKNKRKRAVIIALLTILLLVGSALYFFIEMQLSSQDLFITDNVSSDEIIHDRNIQTQITKPISRPLKTSPTQQKAPPPVNNIKTQPARVKPSIKRKSAVKQITAAPLNNKSINIVRNKKVDPLLTLLNNAYIAFNKQNFNRAENLYNQALTREANNRDALLGLAAIGTIQKRFEFSRQKYQHLLQLNPRDSVAIAGMSNIQNHIDPQLNESQLKFMLKQQPDSPHLYFALGSHYSAQNKWPEAQSAFFSAWSADNKNADYAYNLAVSLDHLNKQKQAVDFYQLSLKLQKSGNGNFSSSDVNKRIGSIQEHLK